MSREFQDWLIAERARALATVLLTRRRDLHVRETKEENSLDYTLDIDTKTNAANCPFGVSLASAMTPVTLDAASKELKRAIAKVQSARRFHFPVCVFYFTVKDGEGYYAWAYEPVTEGGQPRLKSPAEPQARRLGDEALAEIISTVKSWYDVFYATITSGNGARNEKGGKKVSGRLLEK